MSNSGGNYMGRGVSPMSNAYGGVQSGTPGIIGGAPGPTGGKPPPGLIGGAPGPTPFGPPGGIPGGYPGPAQGSNPHGIPGGSPGPAGPIGVDINQGGNMGYGYTPPAPSQGGYQPGGFSPGGGFGGSQGGSFNGGQRGAQPPNGAMAFYNPLQSQGPGAGNYGGANQQGYLERAAQDQTRAMAGGPTMNTAGPFNPFANPQAAMDPNSDQFKALQAFDATYMPGVRQASDQWHNGQIDTATALAQQRAAQMAAGVGGANDPRRAYWPAGYNPGNGQ